MALGNIRLLEEAGIINTVPQKRARLLCREGEAGPGTVGTNTVPMSYCNMQHGGVTKG